VLVGPPPVAVAMEPGVLEFGALDSAAVVLAVTLFCPGAGDGVASSAQARGMLTSGRSRRRVRRGWRMLGEALGAQMMPSPRQKASYSELDWLSCRPMARIVGLGENIPSSTHATPRRVASKERIAIEDSRP
jgi:hypothetical protein